MKLKSSRTFRPDGKEWNKSTLQRHIRRSYYKCRNMKAFRELVRTKKTRDIILEITDRIVEKFDPETVILHGSRAKGTASRNSDLDFFVIMKGNMDTIGAAWLMIEATMGCPLKRDFKVATPKLVGEWAHVRSSLYNNAIRFGFHLYEKTFKQSDWYLKNAGHFLKNIRKKPDRSSNADYAYVSIKHTLLAAIIADGNDIPTTKKLNEMAVGLTKWNINKHINDLEKLQNRVLNNEDAVKLAFDIHGAIKKELENRNV